MNQILADSPWSLPVFFGGLLLSALFNALLLGLMDRGVQALQRRAR